MRTISSYGSIFLITSSILSFFASISCSEKSEIDRMNEIWDKAELWRNLEDNNGTVRSKKLVKFLQVGEKKYFQVEIFISSLILFLAMQKEYYNGILEV